MMKLLEKFNFDGIWQKEGINNIVYDLERNTAKLIKEKVIKISSFGTFHVRQKGERVGRNPKTKVETKISARKVVTFKPSFFIKNKVNEL